MDAAQLTQLIAAGENQEVEFKESLHSYQDISKAICAFANTAGGVLVIGVAANGNIKGVSDADAVQQGLSSANQSISPVPLMSVEVHQLSHKRIVVAIVQRPADNQFYTFHGAIHVRIGSTIQRLEGQTQLDFLRSRQILSFDETAEPTARVDDLDESKIRNYLAARNQDDFLRAHSLQDFLVSNRLLSSGLQPQLKNAAVLLFGRTPARFFPQAELRLVQFAGTEAVEVLQHKIIQEDIVATIEQSLAFLKSILPRGMQISDAKRTDLYKYPLPVLRESLVNAIAHRDYFSRDAVQISVYDDRLEITNPGSLPQALPKELFGTISVQRNPITYRFLRDMGYVEGLGTGVPRMKNEMRKAGLRDPEFIITDTFFRVVLYNEKGTQKPITIKTELNVRQQKALEYLSKHKMIKSKTYCEINNVSAATAVKDLNEMADFGFIKKYGKYRGAYYALAEPAQNI